VNNYLISIRKPFTDLIFHLDPFERIKTNEWRKKPLPIGHYYVYESKYKRGCGKVVGEFDIVENHEFPIGSISFEDCQAHDLVHQGIVPYGFLKHYANGAEIICANIIRNTKYYQEPRELNEFWGRIRCLSEHTPYCWSCFGACIEREGARYQPLRRPPQSYCHIWVEEKKK